MNQTPVECGMLRDTVDFISNEVTTSSEKVRLFYSGHSSIILLLCAFVSLILCFIVVAFYIQPWFKHLYSHRETRNHHWLLSNLTRNWSEYPPSLWDSMTSYDGAGTGLFSCWLGSDLNDGHRGGRCWLAVSCLQHKAVLGCSSLGSEIGLMENIFKSKEAFNIFHMQWLRVKIPFSGFSVMAKLSTRCLPLRILQEKYLNVRCDDNNPLK